MKLRPGGVIVPSPQAREGFALCFYCVGRAFRRLPTAEIGRTKPVPRLPQNSQRGHLQTGPTLKQVQRGESYAKE